MNDNNTRIIIYIGIITMFLLLLAAMIHFTSSITAAATTSTRKGVARDLPTQNLEILGVLEPVPHLV